MPDGEPHAGVVDVRGVPGGQGLWVLVAVAGDAVDAAEVAWLSSHDGGMEPRGGQGVGGVRQDVATPGRRRGG